ncbi:MAG: hypothetical protein J6S85_19920 [Methanobrevibacter sp.]|nr:hypothetical protein [Methanobrevibacter sp.]
MFKAIRRFFYKRWLIKNYEKAVKADKGKVTFINTIDSAETRKSLNSNCKAKEDL